ncbi:MAG: hypothetical protein ACRDBO_11085 [Lachnospiraceae bacterium]
MIQTKDDCLNFLSEAREALDQVSMLEDQEGHLQQQTRRLERQLEAEQKTVADNIRQTIKKRLDEISSSYDKEITKGQERLKRARSKREKAKSQGVKERIKEETEELHSHNRELRVQMKGLFQQDRVPGFCNTSLFYSLYFPRWFKEILVLLIFLLISFLVIPCGIYYLIPDHQPMYLAGIYLLDVIVIGGIYVIIGNKTRTQHLEALKTGRAIMDQIHSNNRKIHVITSTIRKDRNESQYNLEMFDDEIAQAEQELAEVAEKKKEALNTFENVTKNILTDEIEHNSKEKIDNIRAEYEDKTQELKTIEAQVKEKRLYITDHYSTYLGQEFLDPIKIAELTTMIQGGEASNISVAIEEYKKLPRHRV